MQKRNLVVLLRRQLSDCDQEAPGTFGGCTGYSPAGQGCLLSTLRVHQIELAQYYVTYMLQVIILKDRTRKRIVVY